MNKELIKELELLRFYKEKGCLDTHYKVLIDYIDELEQQNKELHNKIDKLSNENKSLRTRIKTIKRLRKKQTQKKNKYKSIVIDFQKALEKKNNKIDKAIKYINDRMIVEQAFCLDMKQCYELIAILKDSDVDD